MKGNNEMKASFRKYTALLCVAVLAMGLGACGSRSIPLPSQGETETQGEKETKKASADDNAEKKEEAQAGGAAGAGPMLHLEKETERVQHYVEESYRTKFSAEHSYIELTDDSKQQYPKLAAALDAYNEKEEEDFKDTCDSMEDYSVSYIANNPDATGEWSYLSSESVPYVMRADSSVLSILYYHYAFTGGVHPNSAYGSVTFHTQTGKELTLTDVVTDLDAFAQAVDQKLREEDAENYEYYFTDPVQAVKDSVTQDGFMEWTLGYEGMTVYFSPYTLGAYAMGAQVVTIYYDEAPDLFRALPAEADSYILPMNEALPLEVDALGNGSRESIWVESISTSEYSDCDFAVHRGDSSYRLNTYGYSQNSYLVKENGQYYVYVFVGQDNDYVSLYTVDLKTLTAPKNGCIDADEAFFGYSWEQEDGSTEYETKTGIMSDPAAFYLGSRINTLSTMSGYRKYHTGLNGVPVADEEALTIRNTRVLKVLQPITADIVDENGTVTGSTRLIPGTFLFFVRTDDSTFMDMQEADPEDVTSDVNEWYSSYQLEEEGEPDWSKPVYRIRTDRSEWPYKVNGIEEDTVLDGIMYAG